MHRFIVTLVLLALTPGAARAQILDVRELNTHQIAALDRARTAVLLTDAILEQHGPYLPSYSDGYQAEFIAARVAEAIVARPGWAVLRFPTIPLGTFPASEIGEHHAFPGSYGVRASTLLAVFMDLATDLGEAGFKYVFVVNSHGAPTHNRALDQAARYFTDTYGGRMVHLTGAAAVAGAAPRDLFSAAEREAEGFSVHADADEHSRVLFLRPDTVDAGYRSAPAVVARGTSDLVAIAKRESWTGYFGTPAIANGAAGSRAMRAIAEAAADAARRILDGGDDGLPRVADQVAGDPAIKRVLDAELEYERRVEQKQREWLAKQPQ